ncbi:FHA domain-containing protein [Candidatus Woesearchaeota archaeon]|nr:FHA domain-containing protein [Candidatus Woesearchaeota archaeon]
MEKIITNIMPVRLDDKIREFGDYTKEAFLREHEGFDILLASFGETNQTKHESFKTITAPFKKTFFSAKEMYVYELAWPLIDWTDVPFVGRLGVGRGLSKNIKLSILDGSVSKLHGFFERKMEKLIYTDTSTNGTYINSMQIKDTSRELKEGNSIIFGNAKMKFVYYLPKMFYYFLKEQKQGK